MGMKKFGPKLSGVVPPKAGDTVSAKCSKCGASCTVKLAPVLNLVVGKCPNCGSTRLVRTGMIVN